MPKVILVQMTTSENHYGDFDCIYGDVSLEEVVDISEEEYQICRFRLPMHSALIRIETKEVATKTIAQLIESNRKQQVLEEKRRKEYAATQMLRDEKRKLKAIEKAKKLLQEVGNG